MKTQIYEEYSGSDQDRYERDLRRRQEEHMKSVNRGVRPWRPCLHDGCSECHGTGIKKDGSGCIHSLSCPCPRCNPFHL